MGVEFLIELPELVTKASIYLRDASPLVLMIVGVALFLFAGVAKWIIKLVGVGLFVYGLLAILQLL